MNRVLTLTSLSLLALTATAHARTLKEIREVGFIRVGVPGDLYPFNFEAGGKYLGYEPELITALASRMEVNVRIEKIPADQLFKALNEDRIDVAMNNLAMTSTRENSIDFTNAYICSGVSIVSAKQVFTKNTELTGKTIGASRGSIMLGYVEKLPFDKTVKVYDSNYELIAATLKRDIDATYAWTSMQAGLKKQFPQVELFWSPEVWSSPSGMAVAAGNNTLKQTLNIHLARFMRSPDLLPLMTKHFGKDVRCK